MNIIALNSYYDCTNHRFFSENGEDLLKQNMITMAEDIAEDIASVTGYWPKGVSKNLNFSITFSDEVINKNSNGKSAEKIASEIGEVVRHMESREEYPAALVERLNRIKTELKETEIDENSLNDKVEELIRITDAANLFNNNEIEASDIYDIKKFIEEIRSRTSSHMVMGDYKNGKITIYIKSICEYAYEKSLSENPMFISVFAHEIFKLYHQECVKNSGNVWDARIQGMKVISESCATFYTWLFCTNCLGDSALAGDIKRNWRGHDFDSWPSSGARYIERYDNWSHDLLKKIFVDSLCNWTDAYRDLIACERLGHNLPIK